MPSAVVFDCDGLLVDSEPHSRRSWVSVLSEIGHPAGEADVAACTGLGYGPTHAELARLAPLPDAELLWPRLLDALEQSFESGLEVFPDALETLDAAMAADIRVAVASASPRQRLDLTLRSAGLIERFAVSVAGDEVVAGKPAPDVYQAVLERLGARPSAALALEDSAIGVAAAAAAGMSVVAVVRDEPARAGLVRTGASVVDRLTPELLTIP